MTVTAVGKKGKRVQKKIGSAEREPGIMFLWIASRMQNYEEPERRGTSRGEKIGYPKNKYFASLFIGLSNFSQKKLSNDFGQKKNIRYGVLRNWCREKDFKEMTAIHTWEFAKHLISHVETKCEESMSEWNDYFNLKTDEQPPELQFDEIYRDAMFSMRVC